MTLQTQKNTHKPFKWVIGIPYFVQGTSYFTEVPILYFIKNVLALGDTGGQLFNSLRSLGWLIKPVWGYISDRIPLYGYRRKSWYILMACLALGFWSFSAGLSLAGVRIPLLYLFVFNFAFTTYAFVDVVCDALMVERGRHLNQVGSFINFQWTVLGLATAAAIYLGGWVQQQILVEKFEYWIVFLLTGIPPLATAYVGWRYIEETPVPHQIELPQSVPSWQRIRLFLQSLPHRFSQFRANNRVIWFLVLFMFFWKFSPSIGFIERSYLIDVRHFRPTSFGTILSVGGITFFLSVLTYRWVVNRYHSISWDQYLYAVVTLAVISFPLSFYLYLHPQHPWWNAFDVFNSWPENLNPLPEWNRYEWFRLLFQTFFGFATIPAFIIPLTLAGETVKLQYAGVGYAFLMSLANVTDMFEGVIGAGLYTLFGNPSMAWLLSSFSGSWLDIAGVPDERTLILQIFVYISMVTTLLTIPFILLLKREFDRQGIAITLGEMK
ncbi:MAG: MFS transporter [Nitrospirales bacterium]|nr:MAG: MFS transporter [Nitrospirales bacterium]